MFGIWTRRIAIHPRFYHDPQPQESPSIGKITRYLVEKQCYMYSLNVADGEVRICVPIPDVINGQFDEGLKLLLGTGGEGSPKDLTVETNK